MEQHNISDPHDKECKYQNDFFAHSPYFDAFIEKEMCSLDLVTGVLDDIREKMTLFNKAGQQMAQSTRSLALSCQLRSVGDTSPKGMDKKRKALGHEMGFVLHRLGEGLTEIASAQEKMCRTIDDALAAHIRENAAKEIEKAKTMAEEARTQTDRAEDLFFEYLTGDEAGGNFQNVPLSDESDKSSSNNSNKNKRDLDLSKTLKVAKWDHMMQRIQVEQSTATLYRFKLCRHINDTKFYRNQELGDISGKFLREMKTYLNGILCSDMMLRLNLCLNKNRATHKKLVSKYETEGKQLWEDGEERIFDMLEKLKNTALQSQKDLRIKRKSITEAIDFETWTIEDTEKQTQIFDLPSRLAECSQHSRAPAKDVLLESWLYRYNSVTMEWVKGWYAMKNDGIYRIEVNSELQRSEKRISMLKTKVCDFEICDLQKLQDEPSRRFCFQLITPDQEPIILQARGSDEWSAWTADTLCSVTKRHTNKNQISSKVEIDTLNTQNKTASNKDNEDSVFCGDSSCSNATEATASTTMSAVDVTGFPNNTGSIDNIPVLKEEHTKAQTVLENKGNFETNDRPASTLSKLQDIFDDGRAIKVNAQKDSVKIDAGKGGQTLIDSPSSRPTASLSRLEMDTASKKSVSTGRLSKLDTAVENNSCSLGPSQRKTKGMSRTKLGTDVKSKVDLDNARSKRDLFRKSMSLRSMPRSREIAEHESNSPGISSRPRAQGIYKSSSLGSLREQKKKLDFDEKAKNVTLPTKTMLGNGKVKNNFNERKTSEKIICRWNSGDPDTRRDLFLKSNSLRSLPRSRENTMHKSRSLESSLGGLRRQKKDFREETTNATFSKLRSSTKAERRIADKPARLNATTIDSTRDSLRKYKSLRHCAKRDIKMTRSASLRSLSRHDYNKQRTNSVILNASNINDITNKFPDLEKSSKTHEKVPILSPPKSSLSDARKQEQSSTVESGMKMKVEKDKHDKIIDKEKHPRLDTGNSDSRRNLLRKSKSVRLPRPKENGVSKSISSGSLSKSRSNSSGNLSMQNKKVYFIKKDPNSTFTKYAKPTRSVSEMIKESQKEWKTNERSEMKRSKTDVTEISSMRDMLQKFKSFRNSSRREMMTKSMSTKSLCMTNTMTNSKEVASNIQIIDNKKMSKVMPSRMNSASIGSRRDALRRSKSARISSRPSTMSMNTNPEISKKKEHRMHYIDDLERNAILYTKQDSTEIKAGTNKKHEKGATSSKQDDTNNIEKNANVKSPRRNSLRKANSATFCPSRGKDVFRRTKSAKFLSRPCVAKTATKSESSKKKEVNMDYVDGLERNAVLYKKKESSENKSDVNANLSDNKKDSLNDTENDSTSSPTRDALCKTNSAKIFSKPGLYMGPKSNSLGNLFSDKKHFTKLEPETDIEPKKEEKNAPQNAEGTEGDRKNKDATNKPQISLSNFLTATAVKSHPMAESKSLCSNHYTIHTNSTCVETASVDTRPVTAKVLRVIRASEVQGNRDIALTIAYDSKPVKSTVQNSSISSEEVSTHSRHSTGRMLDSSTGENTSESANNNNKKHKHKHKKKKKHEKKKDTSVNRKIKKIMKANPTCVDCGRPSPDWALLNYGSLACLECCGAHRSLGVSQDKICWLALDKLTDGEIELLQSLGNERVNKIWQSNIGQKKNKLESPDIDHKKREEFLISKYIQKEFLVSSSFYENSSRKRELKKIKLSKSLYNAAQRNDIFAIAHALAHGAQLNWRNEGEELVTASEVAMHNVTLASEGAIACLELLKKNET